MNINLKYKIGEKIEIGNRYLFIIGFEYIKSEGIKYILITQDDAKIERNYLFEYEIELLKKK